MGMCGCHSGTTEREVLAHIGCSPRHCTCAGRAREAEAEGWADLVEDVEIEDTLFEWAEKGRG